MVIVPVEVVPSPQLIVAVNWLAVAYGLASSMTGGVSPLYDWFWPIVIVVPPALMAASATVTVLLTVRRAPPLADNGDADRVVAKGRVGTCAVDFEAAGAVGRDGAGR